MTHDPDTLRAELETAMAAGDLLLEPADLEAFDLPEHLTADDFAIEGQIQTRIHAPARSRPLHPRLIRYANAEAMAREMPDIGVPGARVHAVVSGNFIFGDFLEAWIKARDWLIQDLWVATLSLGAENICSLATLLKGDYVRRLHLQVSDYWFAHERHRNGLVPLAYAELDRGGDRFQLTVTGSHAKVCLLAPIDEATGAPLAHYVLHGSANLRSSASIEQLAIEHDPELYAFHLAWLQALEAQYSTIHPHQPGPAAKKDHQWQQVARTGAPTTPDLERPPKSGPTHSRPARKGSAAMPNSADGGATSE